MSFESVVSAQLVEVPSDSILLFFGSSLCIHGAVLFPLSSALEAFCFASSGGTSMLSGKILLSLSTRTYYNM